MRILVTGGTGFIGSAVTRELKARGHAVYITGRKNEQDVDTPCLGYTFHNIDWSAIDPIDVVFHQAAITDTTHEPDSDFYFVNVHYAKNLFYEAARHGVKRIVYASSCAVYGSLPSPFREEDATVDTPINPYGSSKLIFDQWAMPWAKEAGIIACGLRYSNVYGPGEEHKGKSASMIWQLARQLIEGKNPKLFKWGEQERDFVHIDDVVNANMLAAESPQSGVFNVGYGAATSFNDIIKILKDYLGIDRPTDYIDNPIADKYQNRTVCDLTKSTSVLGYRPQTGVYDGIRRYFQK